MNRKNAFFSWYRDLSLARKLLLAFILVSVLPVLLIQMISYAATTRTMYRQVESLSQLNLEQTYTNARSALSRYENLLFDLYVSDELIGNLNRINVWDSKRYESALNAIDKQLRDAVFEQTGVVGIAAAAVTGEMVYYDAVSLSTVDSFCFEPNSARESDWYRRAMETDGVAYEPARPVKNRFGERDLIYLSRRLVDLRTRDKEPVGVVVLCVDEASLAGTYTGGEVNDWNLLLLASPDGSILSCPDKSLFGKNLFTHGRKSTLDESVREFVSANHLLSGRNSIVRSLQRGREGLIVVNVQDAGYVFGDVWKTSAVLVGLGVIAILFASLVIRYVSRHVGDSARSIISAMQSADGGDLQVRIPVVGEDEFAQISRHFNSMLAAMQAALARERSANRRKTQAQIRALEAQINPHFLYNTLDAINWIAIENHERTISRMLKNLAELLRYSISNSNGVVTVRQDLESVKKYVLLQQLRFNYSFECVLRVPSEVQDCLVHKLLLQPLIENAIIHGFQGRPGGLIEVTMKIQGELLYLFVRDNGQGMDAKTAQEINAYSYEEQMDDNPEQASANCIGMRNVASRIKMYYGEAGTFRVCTPEQGGTQVELTLPLQYEV